MEKKKNPQQQYPLYIKKLDSADNVAVLMESGCYFIIKRNLRKESKDGWFDMAKQYCQDITSPREGKKVYIGSDWKNVTSRQFN